MRTALFGRHVSLGAKMVDFCGWEMPIQYKGIIPEHRSVRERVGIFDVSHMGRVLVEGDDAERFLDYLSTNKISGKPPFSATYTVWCHSSGGSVDDVIVYKIDAKRFFVIVNAANRQKDLDHMLKEGRAFKVNIHDRFKEDGILSIQGPKARTLTEQFFPDSRDLKHMQFELANYNGKPCVVSATGYTGESGVEIYAGNDVIVELWDRYLKDGQPFGIEPIGLGARDTLRLEMGYALYGHELSDSIAPTESVSAWTVKMGKDGFVGKDALDLLDKGKLKRSSHGIALIDKGIAREGYEVYSKGELIGKVTSGTHSPTLNKAIAIVLVKGALEDGEEVDVKIRDNLCRASIVQLPFLIKAKV